MKRHTITRCWEDYLLSHKLSSMGPTWESDHGLKIRGHSLGFASELGVWQVLTDWWEWVSQIQGRWVSKVIEVKKCNQQVDIGVGCGGRWMKMFVSGSLIKISTITMWVSHTQTASPSFIYMLSSATLGSVASLSPIWSRSLDLSLSLIWLYTFFCLSYWVTEGFTFLTLTFFFSFFIYFI